jgi:hypothetical protein
LWGNTLVSIVCSQHSFSAVLVGQHTGIDSVLTHSFSAVLVGQHTGIVVPVHRIGALRTAIGSA